tara:strand:- start:390 stop:1181 length:792 start_codon:yes stop_codon:yes gene_type:complete
MKKGLENFSYIQVATLRILIAFIVLSPFLFRSFKKVNKSHILPLIITGFFGNGFPAFLFAKAQTILDSSFTGILNSLTPIFTLLFGVFIFGRFYKRANIIGVILGFTGVIFFYFFTTNNLDFSILGLFLVIIAVICYAISVNVIHKYLMDLDAISITSISFLFIFPFSLIPILDIDLVYIVSNQAAFISLFCIIILGIICTALAVIIFNKLIKRTSAIFATSVTYIIPIIAIFWGFFDHERIYLEYIFGLMLIFIGIYFINKR